MRWNKILFLCYLLSIIWSCTNEPEGPVNPPDPEYIYGGQISDIGKIYVDKVSVAESLNVVSITLSLSGGHANEITTWTTSDPDDPATDIDLVDPNDVYGPLGDDNGYIGTGYDDYFPVILPTFHQSKSDAYDEIFDLENFYTDENGRVRLFMCVYPDNSIYQGYHPGDNFGIRCVIGDTAYYSDINNPLTSWKKIRIEYDYMEGCTLTTVGFTTIERAFKGENILKGGNRDYNHCTYLEFKDDSRQDSIHLWRSDKDLTRFAFNNANHMYYFYLDYRDDSTNYPFYFVGACSLQSHPNAAGVCLFDTSGFIRTPFMSSVFVPKIINVCSGSLNPNDLEKMIGLIAVHELGHFAAKLTDAYLEPQDHTDTTNCFMAGAKWPLQNLINGKNMFFCPACIRRFRGNMYIEGPQVFLKRGEK